MTKYPSVFNFDNMKETTLLVSRPDSQPFFNTTVGISGWASPVLAERGSTAEWKDPIVHSFSLEVKYCFPQHE